MDSVLKRSTHRRVRPSRPSDPYRFWDEIAFRRALTWVADVDRRRIEQKGCIMLPHGHFGFDLDRFCWKLIHEGPDAIVYADSSGLILFWNHGAERIFGYSAKEAIGNSLDLIMPENLRARHWAAYGETMRTGKTRYGEGDVLAVPALGKGGTRISIEFTIFPYHDRDGSVRGVGAILRDVTKRFEETKALRKEAAARHATPPSPSSD